LKASSEIAAKEGPYETYAGSPVSKVCLMSVNVPVICANYIMRLCLSIHFTQRNLTDVEKNRTIFVLAISDKAFKEMPAFSMIYLATVEKSSPTVPVR
jgi:hypothetical protein